MFVCGLQFPLSNYHTHGLHPLLILAVGMALVLGAIVLLRLNAFVALIAAAMLVSLLAPGPLDEKLTRVAEAFGTTAGSIAIVIAMAAIVGQCMMESGAADRVVRAFLNVLGENRGGAALAGSGFLLSIPVFFDTVFYLLIPLARSMYLRTGRHYLRYVMAIAAGGTVTHTLVPPTPGPMIIADTLKVDLGLMMVIGLLIGAPVTLVGLAVARWMDRRYPLVMRPIPGSDGDAAPVPAVAPPGLFPALLPILLPVVLISTHTILSRLAAGAPDGAPIAAARQWTALLGNPNLALMAAAAVAVALYVRQRRATRAQTARMIEGALMSAGLIILITAGGGAFGAMLRAAQIGPSIQRLFAGDAAASGVIILLLAFGIASVLKFAQGSSTVAMITTAGMMAAMIEPASLSFNVVYLAIAVGAGSLVGSWMNDSGFWIYCRMGGMTEPEALRSWTVLLALLGITAMAINVLLAVMMPMRPDAAGTGFGRPAQDTPRIERLDPALDRLVHN